MLFNDSAKLLGLYNAMNGSHYEDPGELSVRTMENAIYLGYHNDVSFLLDSELNLYEHQSTDNPNMPLRDLLYIGRQLEGLFTKASLYSSTHIRLPLPRFVVFYNGTKKMPDRWTMQLSDAYLKKTDDPDLELKVHVININPGCNEEIKKACKTLDDYCKYVQRVRLYARSLPLEEAVDRAVTECIKENILADFLSEQRARVVFMSIFEWNQEEEWRKFRQAEFENGKRTAYAENIIDLLSEYGDVPENLEKRILNEIDISLLKKWLKAAARAASVKDFVETNGLKF